MKCGGYIKRYTPIKKKRHRKGEETVGKMGCIRLRGKKLEALRLAVFERDGYRCQYVVSKFPTVICGRRLDWGGPNSGHMAHIFARGAGGSDTLENTRLLCPFHHGVEHTKGKSYESSRPLSDL